MVDDYYNPVTGLILAGGAGSRLGGVDKGWVALDGKPLVKRSMAMLAPQVGKILISANRSITQYQALGVSVVTDERPGFGGPLMGMLAGMRALQTDYLLCAPVDAAALPPDLAERLLVTLAEGRTNAAVVHDGERMQPLCCLLKGELTEQLERAVADGETSPRRWLASVQPAEVDFSDWPRRYWSLNTPEELAALESDAGIMDA